MAIIQSETRKLSNGAKIRVWDDDIKEEHFKEFEEDFSFFREALYRQAERYAKEKAQ